MKQRAFTLIELLVVISIISVLIGSAFAILRPLDYIKRSRDSRRQSDLKVVQAALEQYYSTNGAYPNFVPFGSVWTAGTPPITYLRTTPNDPLAPSQNYCYQYTSPDYNLCANLEFPPATGGGTCNSVNYNYCQTNPF